VRLGGVGELFAELDAELTRRPSHLLLDNFEHVAPAAADVARLLESCPDVVALVTSRHVLRVHGEHDHPVPPLSAEAAAELFAERTAAARPTLALTQADRADIDEIARRLDRLPLAIELAAACMRLFTPSRLLAELSNRTDLLSRGAADAAERQRTLRATMDWSYDLLDEPERLLFARLGVFNGSWTLAAAETVCARAEEPEVLETLASLVEKSLVHAIDDEQSEPRLRMLETVRTYAGEKLAALPDREETEHRHTAWIFELLLGPSRSIRPPHHQSWLERFDLDRADLRGAVERALRNGDAPTVANLVRAALGYLSLRDAEAEAAGWLAAARAQAEDLAPIVRAQLLVAEALMVAALGRYGDAAALMEQARQAGVASEDPYDIAMAAMAEAVLASAERQDLGACDAAAAAAEAWAAFGSDVGEAFMWQTAGTIALVCSPDSADGYLQRALELAESMANDGLRGQALTLLGYSARQDGRRDDARTLFVAAAEAALRSGQRSSMAYALDGLAAAAVDLDRFDLAAEALSCSDCARSTVDRTSWASFHPLRAEVIDRSRAALGDQSYADVCTSGAGSDVGRMLRAVLDAVR
jgi:predicted ATPase